jgi:RNA polymerase sigma factor for flagellar operon FliA
MRYMNQADINENLDLIKPIAASITARTPPCYEYDDLYSVGAIGLIMASENYDPARGEFRQYAKRSIQYAIIDNIRDSDYIPRAARNWEARVEKEAASGKSDEEICESLGITLEKYYTKKAHIDDGRSLTVAGQIIDRETPESDDNPFDDLVEKRQREALYSAIRKLSPKHSLAIVGYYFAEEKLQFIAATLGVTEGLSEHTEIISGLKSDDRARKQFRLASWEDNLRRLPERRQTAILYRYGLKGYKPHTLKETGQKLGGISREWTRQMIKHALAMIRRYMKGAELEHD